MYSVYGEDQIDHEYEACINLWAKVFENDLKEINSYIKVCKKYGITHNTSNKMAEKIKCSRMTKYDRELFNNCYSRYSLSILDQPEQFIKQKISNIFS